MIAAAQSGFVNQILRRLASTAPDTDSALITSTGATDLRRVFRGSELDSIIQAYARGIKVAFAITIAAGGITAITSLATRWDNVNKKKASA